MKYRYKPKRNRSYFRKRRLKKGASVLHRAPFVNGVRTGHSRAKKKINILSWLATLIFFGFIAGVIGVGMVFALVSRNLPDPNKLLTREVEKSTKIWDRTGKNLLYEIHGNQKRTIVELEDIAQVAVYATLASEDKNFYNHRGVNLKSLVRAFWNAATRNGRVQGTSTITQQLIKNAILSPERRISRKVKEIILSYQIERKFSKKEILKLYFNEIPYGSVTYGIESASQSYFGKSASELDAAEAALLSALPKAPSRLSPYGSQSDELVWWQKFILDVMADEGYLTKDQAEEAKAVDILSRIKPRRESIEAPHFSLYVKELLAEKYGEREVETGGLNVITTLDYEMQKAAEEAVADGMETVHKFGGSNAALVSIDPKTGQVLAMVGSADYFDEEIDGNVNVTVRARQPGSSMKPVAYAAAFEKGFTPDTMLFDVNTSFTANTGGKQYEPKNYDLGERGPVTMKKALAGSLNIPAVKTLYLAGLDETLELTKLMGYTTLEDKARFGLSLVLGGGEVKPIEHAAAFATFANEGTYYKPSIIMRVESADGTVLQKWEEEKTENVMEVETARNINAIISDNEARSYMFGENNYLTLGSRPVAAKTGTTNNFNDAWTIGYTPDLVTAVWTGNNDNTPMKSRADGSRLAAPIWNAFMRKALEGKPETPFNAPEPIKTEKPILDGQAGETVILIDKFSGKLASDNTPESAIEEKIFRQAHSILFYINKDDPRGPQPVSPEQDPQFDNWENAVIDWAVRENWTTTESPPTEIDSSRDPALAPTISFVIPEDNSDILTRNFRAQINASAPRGVNRVEYYLEGVLIGTSRVAPWSVVLNIPGTFDKGFYTLRATAFDDIDNNSSQEITVNVQSDGKPLNINWLRPGADIGYRATSFPIFIDARMTENRGVDSIDIFAVPEKGEAIKIGTLNNPKTHGVSVTWEKSPETGVYGLRAVFNLTFDESKTFDGPKITVR